MSLSTRSWIDPFLKVILLTVSSSSLLIVVLIFLFLGKEGLPFFVSRGFIDLLDPTWNPSSAIEPSFGFLPLLNGSLMVTVIALIVAVPISMIGAIYISEIAHRRENQVLKLLIEILAGIPSVVIGFFGLVVLSPLIKSVFHWQSGLTALTGGILLGLMAIPTIMTISEDALQSVPKQLREASFALGATKMETILKIVFPAALPGTFAAIMLGMGRIIGETMAVLMVTGNAAVLTLSPADSVRTLTATIAAEMGEVTFDSLHYQALFVAGSLLLVITFILNMLAQKILKRYRPSV